MGDENIEPEQALRQMLFQGRATAYLFTRHGLYVSKKGGEPKLHPREVVRRNASSRFQVMFEKPQAEQDWAHVVDGVLEWDNDEGGATMECALFNRVDAAVHLCAAKSPKVAKRGLEAMCMDGNLEDVQYAVAQLLEGGKNLVDADGIHLGLYQLIRRGAITTAKWYVEHLDLHDLGDPLYELATCWREYPDQDIEWLRR